MEQTKLFISPVVDLKYHSLPDYALHAMQTVYAAGKAINQSNKYGPSIETIIIEVIHQDYDSKFHQPCLMYDLDTKSLEAGLKVNLESLLNSNFLEAVELYKELIFQVLDQMEEQVEQYDLEGLKRDFENAIEEEIRVME